jgi:UDP-GlcNAc3NAcA epimerase
MKKILTIVGARPQFVKASMLSRAIRSTAELTEIIVHTGQHYDPAMSDVFFDELGIPAPAHSLGIAGGGHGDMTGRMLCALEPVMLAEAPDIVVVYGDTNSTIAGALTAAKLHVPIAHVEAGLRSFNRRMPEEVNRVLTDHLADFLLCPTQTAVQNLAVEGVHNGVHLVGDIMYDAALHFGAIAANMAKGQLGRDLAERGYVLATVHRQENTDDPRKLRRIVDALIALSKEIPVVVPLHPRTRSRLEGLGLDTVDTPNLHIVAPLGYLEMLALERSAALIITDSGGVQKEAYFFRVPCVTLRDQTEWTELVDLGWNRLVDVLEDDILAAVRQAIGRFGDAKAAPYGIGNTSQLIVDTLVAALAR